MQSVETSAAGKIVLISDSVRRIDHRNYLWETRFSDEKFCKLYSPKIMIDTNKIYTEK